MAQETRPNEAFSWSDDRLLAAYEEAGRTPAGTRQVDRPLALTWWDTPAAWRRYLHGVVIARFRGVRYPDGRHRIGTVLSCTESVRAIPGPHQGLPVTTSGIHVRYEVRRAAYDVDDGWIVALTPLHAPEASDFSWYRPSGFVRNPEDGSHVVLGERGEFLTAGASKDEADTIAVIFGYHRRAIVRGPRAASGRRIAAAVPHP